MDSINILAFYWRLDAFTSTSIPLEARIAIFTQSWVTNAVAVFVVPNLVWLAKSLVKADALVGFWNPEEVSSRAGAGCILARTV